MNKTAQQMLDAILGMNRSREERRADELATVDRAHEHCARLQAEARAALAAGDLQAAEDLLNRAEAANRAARHYISRASRIR
ncbi:hypothetical protein SEA_EDUGATOR_86 [Mycobacterium phage Edugator]|uniref:Uncharacterized protein n=1 Tax=Mycobacterium phage Edugator TaxID=2015843 RepID=A0A222ZLZ5_9CAUD|nr:hypothetical protein SEA_EDUGATOR_86 [Mycobacterium phage Edugator]